MAIPRRRAIIPDGMRRTPTKEPEPISCDGYRYNPATDERLDFLVQRVIEGQSGGELMAYLESITTRRVLGPMASDQELRHLEGARWLVGILRTRHANAKARNAAALTREK